MTEKPKAPPSGSKSPFVGRAMQAELDSLFEECEHLDLGGTPDEDDVELEGHRHEHERPTTGLEPACQKPRRHGADALIQLAVGELAVPVDERRLVRRALGVVLQERDEVQRSAFP